MTAAYDINFINITSCVQLNCNGAALFDIYTNLTCDFEWKAPSHALKCKCSLLILEFNRWGKFLSVLSIWAEKKIIKKNKNKKSKHFMMEFILYPTSYCFNPQVFKC